MIEPSRQKGGAQPKDGSGQDGASSGSDFRSAYIPTATSWLGTGQSVGIFAFEGYDRTDINNYANLVAAGFPNNTITSIVVTNVLLDDFDPDPGDDFFRQAETTLDIEMVMDMAPGLSSIIVYEGSNQADMLAQMATDNTANQLTCSWSWTGGPSNRWINYSLSLLRKASPFSMPRATVMRSRWTLTRKTALTILRLTNAPSSSPYITQVGGTTLTTTGPGGSWVSETTWQRANGVGSSGGISSYYSIPDWQADIDMTANQGSPNFATFPM